MEQVVSFSRVQTCSESIERDTIGTNIQDKTRWRPTSEVKGFASGAGESMNPDSEVAGTGFVVEGIAKRRCGTRSTAVMTRNQRLERTFGDELL
jgi:hypothetical protein